MDPKTSTFAAKIAELQTGRDKPKRFTIRGNGWARKARIESIDGDIVVLRDKTGRAAYVRVGAVQAIEDADFTAGDATR